MTALTLRRALQFGASCLSILTGRTACRGCGQALRLAGEWPDDYFCGACPARRNGIYESGEVR